MQRRGFIGRILGLCAAALGLKAAAPDARTSIASSTISSEVVDCGWQHGGTMYFYQDGKLVRESKFETCETPGLYACNIPPLTTGTYHASTNPPGSMS